MSNKAKPMLPEDRYRLLGSAVYYTLQGVSLIGWWFLLWQVPNSRVFFRTSVMSDTALMSILWADLIFLGLGSCLCGLMLWKRPEHGFTQPLSWMLFGGNIYPMVYTCWSTYITSGEGWAASIGMLLLSAGSFFAAWTAGIDNPLFRVAPERTQIGHIFRTFLHTVVFWFISLVLIPWLLIQAEHALHIPSFSTPLQSWLPCVGFTGFGLLNLTTGYVMSNWGKGTPLPLETASVLVVRGPYRFVRNPMAISGLSLGLMVGWWIGSWLTLTIVILAGITWHTFVRPIEEQDLEQRFGEDYITYKNQIRNWIPTIKPAPIAP